MSADDVALSRTLSFLLRHHPGRFGVTLDDAGWAAVSSVLAGLARHGHLVDRAALEALVARGPKLRFELSEDRQRVRAAHGHSVDVDLNLAPSAPPAVLFHGTVKGALESIRAEGLSPRSRRLVHLSEQEDAAIEVGSRRGTCVVLRIAAARMHADGHAFYRSTSGVWLTQRVPPEYLD